MKGNSLLKIVWFLKNVITLKYSYIKKRYNTAFVYTKWCFIRLCDLFITHWLQSDTVSVWFEAERLQSFWGSLTSSPSLHYMVAWRRERSIISSSGLGVSGAGGLFPSNSGQCPSPCIWLKWNSSQWTPGDTKTWGHLKVEASPLFLYNSDVQWSRWNYRDCFESKREACNFKEVWVKGLKGIVPLMK